MRAANDVVLAYVITGDAAQVYLDAKMTKVLAEAETIAKKANATPEMVRALRTLHAHPGIYNPILLARELWLDRVFLFAIISMGGAILLTAIGLLLCVKVFPDFLENHDRKQATVPNP